MAYQHAFESAAESGAMRGGGYENFV